MTAWPAKTADQRLALWALEAKLPPEVRMKSQERAYTSPIWYTPNQNLGKS